MSPTIPSDVDERELRIALKAVQLYAETHPRPTQVSQTQAAELLGLSRKTIGSYLKTGRLRFNRSGRIAIEEIDKLRSTA